MRFVQLGPALQTLQTGYKSTPPPRKQRRVSAEYIHALLQLRCQPFKSSDVQTDQLMTTVVVVIKHQ